MKSASNTLPDQPISGVTAGVDWARDDHAGRARKDLVSHRVAVANQLRAHLRNTFPGAVGLFAEIDSPISLAFLARFDTQDRADWLSPKRLAAWLASVG